MQRKTSVARQKQKALIFLDILVLIDTKAKKRAIFE
jgi:hypothetical protein